MRDLQRIRAMLADAYICSPCRLVLCCASAARSAEYFLAFPCPAPSWSAGQENHFIDHYIVCTAVLTQLYRWQGTCCGHPSALPCTYPWLTLAALSSSHKPAGSLLGDLLKFQRKLESSKKARRQQGRQVQTPNLFL